MLHPSFWDGVFLFVKIAGILTVLKNKKIRAQYLSINPVKAFVSICF